MVHLHICSGAYLRHDRGWRVGWTGPDGCVSEAVLHLNCGWLPVEKAGWSLVAVGQLQADRRKGRSGHNVMFYGGSALCL